jgi:large subunit ribosomal protein L7/L12
MADINSIVESLSSLTVLEAADLVKQLEVKWGVSAAAAAAAPAGPAAAAAPKEEQTEFTVILAKAGDKKMTGLGLKEAKDLVEGAPKTVKEGANKDDANKMKEKLAAAGATVELK